MVNAQNGSSSRRQCAPPPRLQTQRLLSRKTGTEVNDTATTLAIVGFQPNGPWKSSSSDCVRTTPTTDTIEYLTALCARPPVTRSSSSIAIDIVIGR